MKKQIFALLALVALAVSVSSCDDKGGDTSDKATYKVGDVYKVKGVKGVVYQIDAIGKHGMIVSLDQTRLSWASKDAEGIVTGAGDLSDGAKNMAVIEKLADWKTNYPPFAWCAAKNVNGISGWVLPANEQISALYFGWKTDYVAFNKTLTSNGGVAISGITVPDGDSYYWSSTEANGFMSDAFQFREDGAIDSPLKSESQFVRAVRAF